MESLFTNRLATLSHPQRLAIFRLLMRRCPDELSAGEIHLALNLKPSTASVYLGALNRVGLIHQTRHRTSLCYRVNLDAARQVVSDLFMGCCRGRADLCPPVLADDAGTTPSGATGKFNVLFICTANSARSIMAEAILRHIAGDRFAAFSAGTQPAQAPNPQALETLRAKGYDTAHLHSKTLSALHGDDAPDMDFVFTVCDRAANEDCPTWPGHPISAHWGLADPVSETATQAERMIAFQATYGALRNRISAFAALPFDSLSRASLQRRIDQITSVKDSA